MTGTTATQPQPLQIDQEVEFDDGRGNTLTGVVVRVWTNSPCVTIATSFEDRPRKFVRMIREVQRTSRA